MIGQMQPHDTDHGELVLAEMDGGVLRVTLNRPEKVNALTPPMSFRLAAVLQAAARDPQVRCVLITGAGRAFCAGGDVTQFLANDPSDPVAARSSGHPAWSGAEYLADRLRERMQSSLLLHAMPKPTVAMVRGPAMGAGLGLMAACDIRLADTTASFGTAFGKVGLSGDFGVSYFLGRLVGPTVAREMYFLDRRLDAAEAAQHGLVNRTVDPDALEAEAGAIAARLAAGPPIAWRYVKQNLAAAETERLSDVLDLEARNMIRTMATDDSRNAIDGFLSRKTVSFGGC